MGLGGGISDTIKGWGWAFGAMVFLALAAFGSYRLSIAPSVWREVPVLLGCVAAPTVAIGLWLPARDTHSLVRIAALSAGGLIATRWACYGFLRILRARGFLVENVLIVGAGQVGIDLALSLQEHPEYGMEPVGFLDGFPDTGLPLPILGTLDSLERVLGEYQVRRAVLAFGAVREPDVVPIVRACEQAAVDIHVLPRFFELGFAAKGRDVDCIWGMPLLRLRRAPWRSVTWKLKRAIDVLVASLVLLVASPLYLLITLLVKTTSRGPVYHRQGRIGRDGQIMEILKFRSMQLNDDFDTQWSVGDDARTTAVGRLIRRFSLDELPQLINVLKGEMSLVGPRPERPYFVKRFQTEIPRYVDRHRVQPGLTGLAQVNGLRGDTPIDQRARLDNFYIENWSLSGDLSILLRTVAAVSRDAIRRRPRPQLADPGPALSVAAGGRQASAS